MRPPEVRAMFEDEEVVDCFAGGGGASLGIEWAIGRSPDIAVNHDPQAVAMHAANHPATRHLVCDVREVRPRDVCRRRVAFAWFSPDCTYHSKARGGKPYRNRKEARCRRGLAHVVITWAREVRPGVIFLENVEEFQDWGPLDLDGKPIPEKAGLSFRIWLGKLKALGYQVEMRELRACDYGAPTTRKRLFIIARCDGRPIVWPQPTHGPGRSQPHRAAAECIQWELPTRSIFDRKEPLADKTLLRIARGVMRYVVEAAEPFIVSYYRTGTARRLTEPLPTATTRDRFGLVGATLIHSGNGEREGQAPRVYDITRPLGTIMAQGQKHALISAFLAKHYGGGPTKATGSSLADPIGTITTQDHHGRVDVVAAREGDPARVRAFLTKFYGTSTGQPLQLPLGTVTAKGWKHGLVTVHGEQYQIVDIGHRMLQPRELYRGQGFPDSYVIDGIVAEVVTKTGKRARKLLTKTDQIRMCGNSVAPWMAYALVRANVVAMEALAA
jgi:DNA (cytosine-5)-methyltransferase 1